MERLERHDHPSDEEVITWGEVRELGHAISQRFRRALYLMLVIILAVGALVVALAYSEVKTVERVQTNTVNLASSICSQVRYLQNVANNPKTNPDNANAINDLVVTLRNNQRCAAPIRPILP
jgi:hypothetical protein